MLVLGGPFTKEELIHLGHTLEGLSEMGEVQKRKPLILFEKARKKIDQGQQKLSQNETVIGK